MAAKISHEDYETIELENRYSPTEADLDSPGQSVARPLLQGESSSSGNVDMETTLALTPKRVTPIPKLQILTLCAVRIVDPIRYDLYNLFGDCFWTFLTHLISFTQLFPYVNEMMRDLHVTDQDSRIGFYSGLVVCRISRDSFAQLRFIYF